jgi:copper homeostasis protein CutC
LIFGVRYEFDEPWIEEQDRTGNINLTTGQIDYAGHLPVGALPGATSAATWPATSRTTGNGCRTWGLPINSRPRRVRGGYGATSFFEGNSFNQRLTAIAPFLQAAGFSVSAPDHIGAHTQHRSGRLYRYRHLRSVQQFQQWIHRLSAEHSARLCAGVQPDSRICAHPHSFLQAGYVGETGQHIEDYGNVNQLTVNNDQTSAPFYNSPYIGVNGIDSALGVGGNGGLLITESRAKMNYNALQAVLRQRLSHGLEYTVNYTWGKAMTNSLGNYSLDVNGYSGAFQNYYNSGADDGPAGYDIKHNLSGTGVYALPVGRGKEYLSSANRVLDEVIGGWKLSTAVVAYSGFPEVITGGSSNSNSYGSNRVNQYRPLKVVGRSNVNWFGTDPIGACLPGRGSGQRYLRIRRACQQHLRHLPPNGAVRGPGYFNTDMAAFKDFHIIGEHTLGFRFDAFNAFNIVSYGNPDTGINDSTLVTSRSRALARKERHLQFSLKYSDLEFEVMQEEIRHARRLGADGIVLGLLNEQGGVDVPRTQQLVELAGPLPVTFHRAIDMTPQPSRALVGVLAAGARRILTSGGAHNASLGIREIERMVETAQGRIAIMAASGITADTIADIAKQAGVTEFHSSARTEFSSPAQFRKKDVAMGDIRDREYKRFVVREQSVRALADSLERLDGKRVAVQPG